jgi:hypothetical protein
MLTRKEDNAMTTFTPSWAPNPERMGVGFLSETLPVIMQLSAFVFAVTSMLATGLKPAVRQTVAPPLVAVLSTVEARSIDKRR